MVQESLQGRRSFGVAGPGLPVGPFAGQCALVALDLAVGLRTVGPGELVPGTGLGQRGGEQPGPVAGAVVRQHPVKPRVWWRLI